MFLKRLEAFGFKSFAERVVFDFQPGIICLVGPNGCGKSNVVDAVKWVLGEQSAKSLRGEGMLDVIFNGSALRKPLNFSEVTLTFDNTGDEKGFRLPLAAPEVSVTRRLYRSGESEYLINKAHCRLRDIRELFWDTGIGTSSYSIIEQGRIGMLLEANSKERRVLFEEAAGIHKYKERKKIALRKLERVEQNMARLNDVVIEKEASLRSVTRQAEKARKAQEIAGKLRQTRLEILLFDTFAFQSALREADGARSSAQDQLTGLSVDQSQAQAATVTGQEEMGRLDGEWSAAQARHAEAGAALAGLEASLESERGTIQEMSTEAARARQAAQDAGTRAAVLAHEREKAELDLATTRETLLNREESVRLLSESHAAEGTAHAESIRTLERARCEALDILGRRSQHQQALSQAEAGVGGIEYRIRKVRAEVVRAEELLRVALAEAGEVQARMEQVRQRREMLETERSGIRTLLARTEEEIGSQAASAQTLRNQLEKSRSRMTVLEDINESGEGLSPGPRAVLTRQASVGGEDPDLHGLAADCLKVFPQHEAAIEAALGAQLEMLVTGRFATAERCIARLREERLGRAGFLALDRCLAYAIEGARAAGLDASALEAPGCLGRAADLVAVDANFRPVAEALLGDVLLFETPGQAAEAHERDAAPSRWRRVSLSGEIWEPNGAVCAGLHRAERLGPLGRRNEIARLAAELEELNRQMEALAERTGFLEQRAQQLARDEERLTQDLIALAATATELKGMLGAIAREEARSTEEKKVAGDEARELEAERDAHAARVREVREELTRLEAQEAAANLRVAQTSGQVGECEDAVARRRNALEEMKREAATLGARAEGLERHAQSLSSQFAERREELDREQRRAEALDGRRARVEASLAEREAQCAEIAARLAREAEAVRRLAEEKENARLSFEDARGRERAVGQQLEGARAQASEIERQQFERKMRLDAKLEQARAEFQVDAVSELGARGKPPEVSPATLAEAQALEERLQRLGPVNMYALEEQKALESEVAFRRTQTEDLESARTSLRDVIARINRRSRQQFQDTFEAVRTHFQDIFRKLFGGGKADLVLEEGEDILEAGIEILARPPGKEPRSILQLSGGEKAMTTIALLFAVFRSRPAPFCILDEVDAPLDESNVDRFNLIVREFMDRSQFVVITHNKRTMSYGDVLYGVTMPEPGVSKRIAIKYADIEKHLPMDQIESEAAEARKAALLPAPAVARVEETVAAEVEAQVGASVSAGSSGGHM